MGKSKRLSASDRLEIIRPIIENKSSVNQRSKEVNLHHSILSEWVRKFKDDGIQGLENGKGWKPYTKELKNKAVQDVLVHKLSKSEVVRKYKISSRSVLTGWINRYNSEKELESTSTGRVGTIMTEGRKTTYEERIEITEFTIARDKDYKTAMEKYNVSYYQLYSWVQKYEKDGQEGLQDRRGKKINKEESQLSDLEKANLEIKKLKVRNEFLEMQDAFEKITPKNRLYG